MSKYLNGTKLFEIERQLEDLPIDIRIVKKKMITLESRGEATNLNMKK